MPIGGPTTKLTQAPSPAQNIARTRLSLFEFMLQASFHCPVVDEPLIDWAIGCVVFDDDDDDDDKGHECSGSGHAQWPELVRTPSATWTGSS